MILNWGELITLEYGKPVKDKESTDGKVPVYGTNGQIGTSHLPAQCKHPSFILGRKGAYRGVHYSDCPFSVIDTAFYAEPLTDRIDLKWAYYKFLTYDINGMDSGSAIPSTDRYQIYSIEVEVPPLEKQRKIVAVLDCIDRKININQKVNDNLSDLLQTIYQGQFGKVGLANNCGILADICSYSKDKIEISKLSLDTYYSTENMLPEKSGAVKATSLSTTSQTTACHKGDTLISNIRPYFKKIVYCEDDCGCSTDVLCFKPVHPRYTAYLFSTLYADSFFDFMVAGAKGTKMPRGDKQQIMTYPIVLPSEKDLSEFNSVATPILTQIYSNRTESERLSSIRDTLLPKLILGEIDVSSIQL